MTAPEASPAVQQERALAVVGKGLMDRPRFQARLATLDGAPVLWVIGPARYPYRVQVDPASGSFVWMRPPWDKEGRPKIGAVTDPGHAADVIENDVIEYEEKVP